MGNWRKTLMGGLVWLTAALTAVAGTPHLLCHCANGSIRVPGVFSTGQACCASKPAHHAGRKAACPHCHPLATRPAGPEFAGPGCYQTVAQPVVYFTPESRTVYHPVSALDSLPADSVVAIPSWLQASQNDLLHEPDQQPPPTARVIVLQRFLI